MGTDGFHKRKILRTTWLKFL